MGPIPVAEHHNGLIFLLPALTVVDFGEPVIVGVAENENTLY